MLSPFAQGYVAGLGRIGRTGARRSSKWGKRCGGLRYRPAGGTLSAQVAPHGDVRAESPERDSRRDDDQGDIP